MFEKTKRSWKLIKECWRVLRLDKELLVFPLLSSIALLLVLGSFAAMFWIAGPVDTAGIDPAVATSTDTISTTELVSYFAFYFVSYFVITYFNSALVAATMIRFKGGDPTLADGVRGANQHLGHIVAWSALSAFIGVILRVLGERSGMVVRIVTALLGAGWAIASYFAVPAMIVENLGPVDALKRSASIIKKTWGESLLAEMGMALLIFAAKIPGILIIILGAFLLQDYPMAAGGLMLLGVLWILISILISSALDVILKSALYQFGVNGRIDQNFDSSLLEAAFTRAPGS